MSDNGNMKILKNYLVEKENAYLLDDNNNGKTIMLSGKWGSGKTHFWIEKIVKNLKEKKIPNHYISLYGKTSIEQIKNEVFLKIYESVDSDKLLKKTIKTAKSSAGVVSSLVKSVSVFGLSVDLSKITDPVFENVEQIQDENKLKKTEEYLNSGAIICFDDFERKSKDIDLNDLFGFISQLTIEFNCKVVIILNDDVFEGEEKKIFSNVKEKTVSKYLYFNPSIQELFEVIFEKKIKDRNGKEVYKYENLFKHKDMILKTIEETQELNARIYIQILDNILEWGKKRNYDDNLIRCLILVNVNFILYHNIVNKKIYNVGTKVEIYTPVKLEVKSRIDNFLLIYKNIKFISNNQFIYELKNNIKTNKNSSENEKLRNLEILKEDESYIKSSYFATQLNIGRGINDQTFQKINNFIETGILPNE